MTKYYFRLMEQADEMVLCYPLSYHYATMKEEGLTEMTVCEAVIEKVEGYFFCSAEGEVAEKEGCGNTCPWYEPRNKKSGICKSYRYLRTAGKERIIKIKP